MKDSRRDRHGDRIRRLENRAEIEFEFEVCFQRPNLSDLNHNPKE